MLTDSTVRLLRLASESAMRAVSSPNDALGAITLAITALEHYVNFVPEAIKFVHQVRTGTQSQQGRTDGFLILQELNERRGSIRIRLATLCFLLSGKFPDNGSKIFQELHFAIDIRNEIVHPAPKIGDPKKKPEDYHPAWVNRLRETKVLSDEAEWLTAFQIAERTEVARWVVKSVIQFFDHLGLMNDKDHFITGQFHPDSAFPAYRQMKEKLA